MHMDRYINPFPAVQTCWEPRTSKCQRCQGERLSENQLETSHKRSVAWKVCWPLGSSKRIHLCVNTGVDDLHLCGYWLGPLVCQCPAHRRCPEDACIGAPGHVVLSEVSDKEPLKRSTSKTRALATADRALSVRSWGAPTARSLFSATHFRTPCSPLAASFAMPQSLQAKVCKCLHTQAHRHGIRVSTANHTAPSVLTAEDRSNTLEALGCSSNNAVLLHILFINSAILKAQAIGSGDSKRHNI